MHHEPSYDEPSFEARFLESRGALLRFLHRWLRDLHGAEDVLQESWLETLEGRAEGASLVRDESGERLARIAFRLASRERRRARRVKDLVESDACARASEGGVAFALMGRRWSAQALIDLVLPELEALPRRERELVERRYEAQTPTSCLARELGVSRGAVRSRLKRARLRLRQRVEQRLAAICIHEPARREVPGRTAAKGVVR